MNLTSTYQADSILSMPPEQILLRLYDALVTRLVDAEQQLEQGNRKQAATAISRSLHIVTALREALDPSIEADAIPNLDRLYGLVSQWLLEANLNQSPDLVRNSTKIVKTLRDGWTQAVQQVA